MRTFYIVKFSSDSHHLNIIYNIAAISGRASKPISTYHHQFLGQEQPSLQRWHIVKLNSQKVKAPCVLTFRC